MWCIKTILFLLIISSALGRRRKRIIYLGGLFDQNSDDEETFRRAVAQVNANFDDPDVTFAAITKNTSKSNSYESMTTACALLAQRTVAIFGPKNPENINSVHSICDYKDVTHVITRWVEGPQHNSIVNFYPRADALSEAYYDIVSAWEWKSFTVFYEDNESLLRVSYLIKTAKHEGILVSVKQLDETGQALYRVALKRAMQSGETNYVIDCDIDVLEEVLTQAQQVGMMTSNYKYFITNLDTHTINLEPFQYSDVNITTIKVVTGKDPFDDSSELRTESALIYDAVEIVAQAIINNPSMQDLSDEDLSCNSPTSLKHGISVSNDIITSTHHDGLTGLVEFDNERTRSNIHLEVLELHETGIEHIGTWNMNNRLSLVRPMGEITESDPTSLRNKTFIIITCLTPPYGMLKEDTNSLLGNDRFEGFSMDLIQELSQMEGFNYTFIIREDKSTGNKLPNGSWTGMLGDVIEGRADLAITDLTITSARQEGVDFSSPFMNLGISILAKKPGKAPPSFFSFADPFALDTWIMLSLAYCLVSISFFILGRLCPDEWNNPYPCIEEPEFLVNQFSFKNSAWFAIGSLMQQGTEIAPIAIATRMVAGMWWFFVLIMVSSYTANLAAFLTTENPIELFTDVHSLVENLEKYNLRLGAKAKGATAGFFDGKTDPTYKAIFEYMQNHEEDMVSENKDGVKRAEEMNYAFFMESTSIDYETQRHCDLMQYGKLLDDKGYGIAMRKNSTYRKRLTTAILKLQASGKIDVIRRRWWEERRGGGQCSGDSDSAEATPLNLKNVEGVFYVTIGGAICSILFVILEMFAATYKLSVRAKIPFKEALRCEMKAYTNFSSNVKPVPQSKSESKSASGSPKGSKRSESFNNNLQATRPYGFIPSVSRQDLTENL